MDNYIESSYWTERDWQEAKRKGDLAEDSLCRALVQMEGTILHRPFTTDAGHHIDMTAVDIAYDNYPEYQGRYLRGELDSEDECGYLLTRNIDAKYAASAPRIEAVLGGRGMFLVEWRSGCSGLCTPLSDENALTTHLALMRMEDGKPQGHHSFYLLNMADVRTFYLKYNDGSGQYIRPTRNGKYAHCALIDCRKFAEEHGFVYFEYDFQREGWQYQSISREGWQDMPIVERTTYRIANCMRKSEIHALRWENVDFENGKIYVRATVSGQGSKATVMPPKTKAGKRDLPLLPALADILRAYRGEGYVFGGGELFKTSTFDKVYRHVRKHVNLYGATPHIFRHTYITMLAAQNADIKTAQYLAGQADVATTLGVYAHARAGNIKAAGEKFGENMAALMQPVFE